MLLDIQENGIVNVFDDELPEYVKLYFHIDKDNKITLSHKIKQNISFSSRFHEKPPLEDFDVDTKDLYCDMDMADQARTTPYFTKHNNRILTQTFPTARIPNYTDNGLNFIGEAIVNFAISMAVANRFPEESSDMMQRYAAIYKTNKYLAAMCVASGFSKYITDYNVSYSTMARCWKGFIGSLYISNGPAKLPELFDYVNQEVLKTKVMTYQPHLTDWQITVLGLCCFIGGSLFGAVVALYT